MLLQIRKSLSSVVVFVLLALLIASFALFGAGGALTNFGGVVATVGSQKITIDDVRNGFDQEMTRIREQFGSSITTAQAIQFGIHHQVLNQLILTAALNEEADVLGMLGSDEEVRRLIRQMPYFQDLTGNFSTVTYEQTLQQMGWTKEEFETRVRIDIARQQLIEGLTDTALVPAIMQDTLFSFRKEARKAEIATLPPTAVGTIPEPTDEELQAFFEARKTNFQTPEYRDLSFFILSPADFAQNAEFSEEVIQAEYDRRFDEFNTPARRAFQVVILKSEDLVQELLERVNAGEDFSAVSAELTGLSVEELLAEPASYDEVARNYNERSAEAIFNVDIGGISEPVETLVSWQVFRVLDEIPGVERPLEEVRAEIAQTLAEEMGIDALYEAVDVADDEIAAGASLEEIAEAVGKPAIHIPAVSITGQTPEGTLIEQIKVFPYLQEAFRAHPDDELQMVSSPGGDDYYIFRVNGITEPRERTFDEVKDQVRTVWMQEENVRRIGEVARQALAAARAGEDLQTIASRYGGVRFETDYYVRDRVFTQQELSPGIATLMFSLGLGEMDIEQDARGNGYVIVKVLDIQNQDPDESNPEYRALLARLSVEMKNDLFAQYNANLQEVIDIEVNEDLLEGIFDPDFQQGGGLFSGS